jgi:hypothetical protein
MCLLIAALAVSALASCGWASRNVYQDANGLNAGTVVVRNMSPQYRVTLILFEESKDCRGTKFVSHFGEITNREIRAAHRQLLTITAQYSIKATTNESISCGGIYSAPFSQGDLRVTIDSNNAGKNCSLNLKRSSNGSPWKQIDKPKKRTPLTPLLQNGAFCKEMTEG